MLKTRVLVAVVGLPILVAVIVIGGWLFALAVTGALLLAGEEYSRLLRQGSARLPRWLILGLILLLAAATWLDHPELREPGIALLLIAGVANAIWSLERDQLQPFTNTGLAIFGGLYLGWLGSYLLALRQLDDGAVVVLFIYGCVAFSDSAAYFVGRQWGSRKLAPRTSPKKTWEGYVGSVAGGLIFGALVAGLAAREEIGWGHGAAIGLLIGLFGTVGDLAISVIKRQVGAKDSSHLIPGHGGILDRIDSVLVSAALGYYYLVWFVQ